MSRRTKQITWIPISGSPTMTGTEISYHPVRSEETASLGQLIPLMLRADREFQSGEISFDVNRDAGDSMCQVVLNSGLERELFVGLGAHPAAYLLAGFRAGAWEPIASTGWNVPPLVKQWVRLRVRVVGSTIELFVNDVRVLSGQAIVEKAQVGLFVNGPSPVRVRNVTIGEQRPQAFVVMQFTPEFNELFAEVIRPTCESFGYECIRADDLYRNGLIINDVVTSIREASVVIADVTPNNANVFYEVGYSHGIGKPTILLAENGRELPFDISGFRTVFYENTIGGKARVEERLKKHLASV